MFYLLLPDSGDGLSIKLCCDVTDNDRPMTALNVFFLLSLLDSSSSSDEARSPASFLDSSPLSPSHPAFLLPSPASSSYSLHCRAPEPDSPAGSNSSGGSAGDGDGVCFSASQAGSFSAQVKFLMHLLPQWPLAVLRLAFF